MSTEARDWVANPRTFLVAWGIPTIAIIGAMAVSPPARTFLWLMAVVWMGSACLMNARRCRRTHCRFTGPFYLAMAIPVAVHGFDIVSFGPYGWIGLGVFILLGGKMIWWITESRWGKFSGDEESRTAP